MLEDNDFIIQEIVNLCVKDASCHIPCLDFEYEVFAYDMIDEGKHVTISGCGYVSDSGIHVVEGAWTVEEGDWILI